MFTLEQKVDLILRYIATNDRGNQADLKKAIVKALQGNVIVTEKEPDIDELIFGLLREVGMPENLLGYRYIRYAIQLCYDDPEYINKMTSRLYPDVAKAFGTTSSRAERAIRHAIEVIFDRGDLEHIARIFGNTISVNKGKLANGEFLAGATNEIRRRVKHYCKVSA
jgi:two-component system response regulator (stage 0 sporulation protein A)